MNQKLKIFEKINSKFAGKKLVQTYGRICRIVGLLIESLGPKCSIGEVCIIENTAGDEILSEVVGFNDNKVLLMPLHKSQGISPGCRVKACGHTLDVGVGPDMVGKIFDGLGNPIDKLEFDKIDRYEIDRDPPDSLTRERIKEKLILGVKAVDGLLTMGKGQRMGIFAGSGVGKSTLMGMIARNTHADINVISLVGERGREVREFIERDLGEEGLKRSVVVVATSDQPALVRVKCALVATSVAEYFRDQGKDVLLMMDSVTRYALALREVGLAAGEPPATKGYTPSVFASLPRLLERAGTSDKGTISALYTVLVEGADMDEPVADAVRGIIDGHIVLRREIAMQGHYPAIDILESVSRLVTDICHPEHIKLARRLKAIYATYKNSEDLINIGAYAHGSNPEIDYSISRIEGINSFLRQEITENYEFEDTLNDLAEIFME